MDKIGYLGHRKTIEGLEANPKDLKSLTDLPFPGSLRSMQSFLGSLNYYSRFIEDYVIYASVLYELREVEFAELEKRPDLREIMDQNDPIARDHDPPELQLAEPLDERLIRAHKTFIILKTKLAMTPILATSTKRERRLKTNELNYNVTEKEVLVLQRILDLYYNLLVGREIRVLTRHSTLAWLFKSTGLQGRLRQWSALLAPWTLEITKCTKGEDEILGAIAANITPRAKLDDALTNITPRKEPKGAFSAIVWSLPGWEVVKARSGYLESLTMNEAEYDSLLLGRDMLEDLDRKRLVICGDSN
ncbi:reverse transcriptase [Phytophthora megakarya]|uniref:Reverse transcriptase n=1 Tax=Phytophthora megakarya TaxID=4795 RepID=A0A225VTV5_9STRA|nr:reverse transcriptase [Phytophthora megakarya]